MNNSALEQLQTVIEKLIGPDGCPWDKEQTPESLADYVIEEVFELVDAIRSGNTNDICEELGDVLCLILFIAKLYENKSAFSLDTALNYSSEKMIRRHPHVFAGVTFANIDEQLKEWEKIKRSEKKDKDSIQGIYDSLPRALPPLIKAYRIHSKAARINFTWPEDQEVEQQAEAEWLEWLDVSQGQDKDAQMHELGDMLFTLVELGRRKGIKASEALDYTNLRFLERFEKMEALARERGLDFVSLSLDDKDALWNEVKAAQAKKD